MGWKLPSLSNAVKGFEKAVTPYTQYAGKAVSAAVDPLGLGAKTGLVPGSHGTLDFLNDTSDKLTNTFIGKKPDWQPRTFSGEEVSGKSAPGNYVSPSEDKLVSIYGDESKRIPEGVKTYMEGLRSGLTKNVANADYYNQMSGRERGIANARAGLQGTDTSALDEQSRRNAIYGASGVNEAAQRSALADYGKGVANIMTGMNTIEQQDIANKLAAMGTPLPPQNNSKGIFGWLV